MFLIIALPKNDPHSAELFVISFLTTFKLRAVWLTRLAVLQCGRGFARNENGHCTGKFSAFTWPVAPFQPSPGHSFPPPSLNPRWRWVYPLPLRVPPRPSRLHQHLRQLSVPGQAEMQPGLRAQWRRLGLRGWVVHWSSGRILCAACLSPPQLLLTPSPLSPQPRWPTLEAQDRSRIASGRVFASGCSYHTSSAPLCCSGRLPPSLLCYTEMYRNSCRIFVHESRSSRPPLCVPSGSWSHPPHLQTMKKHTNAHASEGTVWHVHHNLGGRGGLVSRWT